MIAIDRILCPVDFSDISRHALEYAVAMAADHDARVTVLHVYMNLPIATPVPSLGAEGLQPVSLVQIDRASVVAAAERFTAAAAGEGRVDLEVHEALDTAAEILAAADAVDASMVVMGSHGRSGFQRLFLGSVAGKVLRRSRRPVMIVPPHTAGKTPSIPFKRVLCPIDFSDGSLAALEYALRMVGESFGLLILLHVIDLPPEMGEAPLATEINIENVRSASSTAALDRLRRVVPSIARNYCAIETRVVEGRAHREILNVAAEERCDLVVMGVQGRGAVDLTLFGSNTLAVVHGSPCPVLTVRA